jgi:alpha-D-ribose 1-methylphosphonate 5-triphosphate synthase subunit PhnL
MNPTAPLLRVTGLSKTFILHQQGGARLNVLEGISLEVRPGECVVLHGPSGAGKSSLLKCIYGNYRATRGSILLHHLDEEHDIAYAAPRTIQRMREYVVGYVSQFLRAVPRVPTLDVVAEPLIGGHARGSDAAMEARYRAEQLLLRLRIPMRLWSVPPATFSGGEQQRVNIARGLIRMKPLLLLDEPTASLDEDSRSTVIEMINEARDAGAAIVGIFHDARARSEVATRVVEMKELGAEHAAQDAE